VVVHLKIHCLRVVGNVAHMSGRISRVSNPDEGEVGELNRVEVRDNGEGGNASPDQVSTIPANPGDADPTTCVDPPTNATIRTVQRGNVNCAADGCRNVRSPSRRVPLLRRRLGRVPQRGAALRQEDEPLLVGQGVSALLALLITGVASRGASATTPEVEVGTDCNHGAP
jgi:hypothetical protein